MFEGVGRGRKVRKNAEAGSILVSLLLNGSLIGAILWSGVQAATEVLEEEEPIEVTFIDEAVAPAPPPPPPPPAGRKRSVVPTEPQPQPEEVEREVEDLKEVTEKPPPDEGTYGVEGGVEGGVVGGVVGGVLGGVPGGQLGGPPVRAVHWSEVQVKKRVQPKMPDAAKELGLSEERCQVRFYIDEKGEPYDVRIEACPAIYQQSALEAAWGWRFYPMKVEGQKVKAQFVLTIVYRLK